MLRLIAAAVALVALLRWPFRTTYLFGFDNASFALAIEQFNPAQHRPQPPGDPLFVLLVYILRPLCFNAHYAQLWAGFIGSGLALTFAGLFGVSIFGKTKHGLAAVLLLLLNPAFWLAGIGNPVRTFLAAGSLAVAFFCWQTLQQPTPGRLNLACFAPGIAAGFRPELLLYLTPLLLYTAWSAPIARRTRITGLFILLATVSTWAGAIVVCSGGLLQTARMMNDYLHAHSTDSVVYGATNGTAFQRLPHVLGWIFESAVVWCWTLPFLLPRYSFRFRPKALFCAIWLLPALTFHLVVHLDHPDQALALIAGLCLVGGAAIASIGRRAWIVALALASAASTWLFFRPVPWLPHASNYYRAAIKPQEQRTRPVLSTLLEWSQQPGQPLAVICWQCDQPTWRIVSYYLPDNDVFVLHAAPGSNTPGHPPEAWRLRNDVDLNGSLTDPIVVPAAARVAWLVPDSVRSQLGTALPPATWTDPVPSTIMQPNQNVQLGPYTINAQ